MNSTKIEIEKIHKSIDKISKKGKDGNFDYHIYVDDMIRKGKYDLFKEALLVKYNIEITTSDTALDVKNNSWKEVLLQTNTSFLEGKQKLMEDREIYQIGLVYYKKSPKTRIIINDPIGNGKGAILNPTIQNGEITSINIQSQGQFYSATSSISISGGRLPATASVSVKSGKIYSTSIDDGGSYHNIDIRLGTIQELDFYGNLPITNKYQQNILKKTENDEYQKFSKNKITKLQALIDEAYTPSLFDDWNYNKSYDKNLLSLYQEAFDYLLLRLDNL